MQARSCASSAQQQQRDTDKMMKQYLPTYLLPGSLSTAAMCLCGLGKASQCAKILIRLCAKNLGRGSTTSGVHVYIGVVVLMVARLSRTILIIYGRSSGLDLLPPEEWLHAGKSRVRCQYSEDGGKDILWPWCFIILESICHGESPVVSHSAMVRAFLASRSGRDRL